jgi:hypothetical protein
VIAVLALRPDANTTAQTQPDSKSVAGLEGTIPTDRIEIPVEVAVENPIAIPAAEMIVADSTTIPNLSSPDSSDPVAPDPVIAPASTDLQMKQQEQPPAPIDAIAKSQDPVRPSAVTDVEIPENMRVIMVLDVRRTEAGRNSDPIGDALAHAKIEPASEKKITEDIAGFAKSTSGNTDENTSVLYLQIPGKKADLFYLHLMRDLVGIESVGLRLAFDPPIMKMVDAIRPDPTTVRHNDAVLQLFSDGGVVDEFTSHLSQLDYRTPDRKAMDDMPSANTGPDISAQILVLVR